MKVIHMSFLAIKDGPEGKAAKRAIQVIRRICDTRVFGICPVGTLTYATTREHIGNFFTDGKLAPNPQQ